jgi:hypothetical protein
MNTITKILFLVGIISVCILIGIYWGSNLGIGKKHEEINSSLVVERIEKVAKLITVEAYMSELYSHKDYYTYDWSFLRKKAIIRVNAKVSAGYDIKKMNITLDSKTKKITIGPIPPVEILSIDHTLDYFDVEEGIFNSFEPQDYNKINAKAKDYIRNLASNHDIIKKASEQENAMIDMMKTMANGMGYELEIVSSTNKLKF